MDAHTLHVVHSHWQGPNGEELPVGVKGIARLATGSVAEINDVFAALLEEARFSSDMREHAKDAVQRDYWEFVESTLQNWADFAKEEICLRANGGTPTPSSGEMLRRANPVEAAAFQSLDLLAFLDEYGVDVAKFKPVEDVLLGPCPMFFGHNDGVGVMIIDPVRKTWQCLECEQGGTARDYLDARFSIDGEEADRIISKVIERHQRNNAGQ